jgi:hypothetical protein
VRLEGSLDAFSLPDIFALLSMTKKTGGLHLRRDADHGVVWVADGLLTGGSTAIRRESLARRVVTATGVDRDALRAAVQRSKDEEIGLVAALSRNGAVDESTVRELAGEHLVDVVFDLLRWDNGDFEFVVDERDRDEAGVSRPVDDVVAEARRRLEEWTTVKDTLPRPDVVLQLAASPDGDVVLDRDQWSLLLLADGRRTVAELVALSGRGEYAAVRCLAGLVGAGVLCERGDGGVSAMIDRLSVIDETEGVPPAVDAIVDAVAPAQREAAEHSAEVTELAASSRGRDLSRVTPQRPEPFLPSRTPDHPDGSVATVGALAAAPATSTHIERDPSVNKSLLLRLIAGVRGL